MKLSQAIRLGAMALPEARGPVIDWKDDRPCGACLVGSALYALMGESLTWDLYHMTPDAVRADLGAFPGWWERSQAILAARWPWVNTEVQHPARCDGYTIEPLVAAMMLYEYEGWSRERVADWIEALESQLDPEGQQRLEAGEQGVVPAVEIQHELIGVRQE